MRIHKTIKLLLIIVVLCGGGILLESVRPNLTDASALVDSRFYYSKHIKFSETIGSELGMSETTNYEVWFNNNGEYKFQVLTGQAEGDYEIWDGKKLYQYTKLNNEMLIRDFLNDGAHGVPIPHELFNIKIKQSIEGDISKGVFKKSIKTNLPEYNYSSNGISINYLFDSDRRMLLHSEYNIKGSIVHAQNVELLEDTKLSDLSLFKIDFSNKHIVNMK